MRIACAHGWLHTGHRGSSLPHTRLAHSMQNMLWPQGTRAATTSLSKQTTQSRLPRLGPEPRESVGELATLSPRATARPSQGRPAGSKVGESPRPSSDSYAKPYSLGGKPNTSANSEGSSSPSPPPVRMAMCASISRLAASTLSGRPVTSNTGSLSLLGVTMYVLVCCWMRLMVAPLGPTTSPTTRYGTRTCNVVWPGMLELGPGAKLPLRWFFRCARIWLKCSAAERISRFAAATSSFRPVTTNTGSSPRTGVFMYVLVLARRALILQPCRPTISATCSELGTGTHSVVFWLFLFLVSASRFGCRESFSLFSPSMESSSANCSARWSSRPPLLRSISGNRLAGITGALAGRTKRV
uniref:Uncharacterized protein n=1 Tax=Rhipicephalus appendiculatus TaxID=34631 RepID=A0A131YTY6_RHIAP